MNYTNSYNIFDKINLVDLCNKIAVFSSKNKSNNEMAKYNSRTSIISLIIPYKSKEWNSELSTLSKIFSGERNVKALKMLPANIGETDFKKKLMKECAKLENTIRSIKTKELETNGIYFLTQLFGDCSSLFFIENELIEIEKSLSNDFAHTDNNFLGLLFFHAFANIGINTPDFAVDRIFKEALTISPDSAMYSKLMKCAADNGHGYAALIYANIIYTQYEVALKYFLIATGSFQDEDKSTRGRPTDSNTESNALWEIGYMFENHHLSESHIKYVDGFLEIDRKISIADSERRMRNIEIVVRSDSDKSLKDRILGYTFSENEISQVTRYSKDKCVIYAMKLYLYIAMKDLSFPKAFNSLGKLILGDYIGRTENVPKKEIEKLRFGLAKNYLDKAILFGNANAMVNLAVFYHNKLKTGKKLSDAERREMQYYLETAASFDERTAQLHLGEIMMQENNYEKAKEYLEYPAEKNDANACHNLGKIYAFNLQDDKAIELFEKAISFGCSNAAYDLAQLYLLRKSAKADNSTIDIYRQYAINLINERFALMSKEYQNKTKDLLNKLKIVLP